MKRNELVGKAFGRLVVVGEAQPRNGRMFWTCLCECGTVKEVSGTHLTTGTCTSCGCWQKDAASARAKRNQIGGYKGYRKYTTVQDVLANTTKNGTCLEWNGPTFRNGYAKIGKTSVFLTSLLHREVFRIQHGYLPEVVMHTCDNRKCLNLDHLKAGTQKMNIQDMQDKGRGNKRINRC